MDMQTRRNPLSATLRTIGIGIGCAVLAGATAVVAQTVPATQLPEAQRELSFEPGIRGSLLYSDNVKLAAPGAEQNGFIAEVSPYFRGTINSPRLTGEVNFSLRSFVRTESDNSWLKSNLNAHGTMALAGNWLWLNANASVADVSALPFGTMSFDPGRYGQNTTQLRTLELSPYVLGHFGTFADYRAQYSVATSSIPDTSNVTARLEHKLSATVKSGSRFNRWGWVWNGETQRREYSSDLVLNRDSSSFKAFYIVNPELRVGAGIYYDGIDGLKNADGDSKGFGPGLNVDWNPNRRTTLRAEAVHQYYGNTAKLSFAHRRDLFTFGLNYTRNVMTSSDGSAFLFDANQLYSAGGFSAETNPIYQALVVDSLLSGYGIPQGAGLLSDGVVQNRSLTASAAYQSLRNRLVVNLYHSVRNSLVDTSFSALSGGIGGATSAIELTMLGELQRSGASATLEHKMAAGTTISVTARQARVESPTLGTTSRLTSLEAGARTKLTTRTTAGVGIRHSEQRGSGIDAVRYDENAVFGGIDVKF